MSGPDNWPVPVSGNDYFQKQARKQDIISRHPVPRVADVLGPGIKPQAVALSDANDPLSLYNGSYFLAAGTPNAPENTFNYVMDVVMTGTTHGMQVAYPMERPGRKYYRSVTRTPADPNTINYGYPLDTYNTSYGNYGSWMLDTSARTPGLFLDTSSNGTIGISSTTAFAFQSVISNNALKWCTDWQDFFSYQNITVGGNLVNNGGILVTQPGVYEINLQLSVSQTTNWSAPPALTIEGTGSVGSSNGQATQAITTTSVNTIPIAFPLSIGFRVMPGTPRLIWVGATKSTAASNWAMYLNSLSRTGN